MDATTKQPFGVRPDKDVGMLIERALKGGNYRSANRIANEAIRAFLTPKFGTPAIRKIQEKLAA